MALVTTVGAANAVSYADENYAETYFSIRPEAQSRWKAVIGDTGGEELLLQAMLILESRTYIGAKADDDQSLEFPRYGGPILRCSDYVLTDELRDFRGRVWPITAIPEPLKQAQCELALALGENKERLDDKYLAKTVKGGSTTTRVAVGRDLPRLTPVVAMLLKPFIQQRETVHL